MVTTPFLNRGGGEGRKFFYKKAGDARQKFWTAPLRGTKVVFCGHGLKFFSPLRDINSRKTHLLSYFFSAQYPQRCRESSRCQPFEAEHPDRYQNHFLLTSERCNEHPILIIYESPPLPPGGIGPDRFCSATFEQLLRFWVPFSILSNFRRVTNFTASFPKVSIFLAYFHYFEITFISNWYFNTFSLEIHKNFTRNSLAFWSVSCVYRFQIWKCRMWPISRMGILC